MPIIWVAAAVALTAVAVGAILRGRAHRLARLRATWGQPIERTRRMTAMADSHRARIAAAGPGGSLDDRTWADLNLDEVFAAIDRTRSTLGQHALYHRLRTAPAAADLNAFEALVGRMTADSAARERAQLTLDRLQDPQGYDIWWLGEANAVERRPWYVVFPALTAATLAAAAMAAFWSAGLTPVVGLLLANVAVRYATDRHIGTIARSFRQCAPLITTAAELRFLNGPDIDPIVAPLRTEVAALRRLKLISRWVNGDPFMLSFHSSALGVAASDVVSVVYEYLNLALLLDGTGMYLATRDLTRAGSSLVRVVSAAGDVDAAIAVASYRSSLDEWSRPEFREAGAAIELTDLRHPLLDGAVPNSIALRSGCGMLVTGSNMSGKSTFLRTLGVNAVLAQTIDTCLARDYRAPIFHVRSCIGRSDDLIRGTSYYVAEVEALLDLVRVSAARAPHLFLLDELFRGTNAVERIAAGQAVLLQLLESEGSWKPHLVVAATHDLELVELTASRFEPFHFGDAIEPGGLAFDHRLRRGPSTSRNAIALLRLYGAPDALVSRALMTAGALDRQRTRVSSG